MTPSEKSLEGQAPPDGPVDKLKVVEATGSLQTWPAGAGNGLKDEPKEQGIHHDKSIAATKLFTGRGGKSAGRSLAAMNNFG